jgi:hypothetical protein
LFFPEHETAQTQCNQRNCGGLRRNDSGGADGPRPRERRFRLVEGSVIDDISAEAAIQAVSGRKIRVRRESSFSPYAPTIDASGSVRRKLERQERRIG